MACPECGSEDTVVDMRGGNPSIPLPYPTSCKDCGHGWVTVLPTAEYFAEEQKKRKRAFWGWFIPPLVCVPILIALNVIDCVNS